MRDKKREVIPKFNHSLSTQNTRLASNPAEGSACKRQKEIEGCKSSGNLKYSLRSTPGSFMQRAPVMVGSGGRALEQSKLRGQRGRGHDLQKFKPPASQRSAVVPHGQRQLSCISLESDSRAPAPDVPRKKQPLQIVPAFPRLVCNLSFTCSWDCGHRHLSDS